MQNIPFDVIEVWEEVENIKRRGAATKRSCRSDELTEKICSKNKFLQSNSIKSIRLRKVRDFHYTPGQYIPIRLPVENDARGGARILSISSSPTEKFLQFTTRISKSPFKQAFNNLKINDKVYLKSTPIGNFTLEESQNAVMITGGIGITPLRSMIKYAIDKTLNINITLFYSNRTQKEIVYRKELEKFSKEYKNFNLINTVTRPEEDKEWKGPTGRIDTDIIKKYPYGENPIFYVCGAPKMVENMINTVKKLNVPEDRIKREEFLGY